MATIIPSTLGSKATAGEKRLHALLHNLPDDCVVYYEPYIDDRVPDFIVICPTLGILVIEEKNWYPKRVTGGDHERIALDIDGHFKSVTHPIRQARDYMHRLMDLTRRSRFAPHFINASGLHQGRFQFPFGYLTVLSNISAPALAERGLNRAFPPQRTVTRDTLETWESLPPEGLLAELRNYFEPFWPITPFTTDQLNALRALIHPEIYFDAQVSLENLDRTPLPVGEQLGVVKALDTRQEDFAGSVGDGHRVVYGVAGSGKTLLLTARAKRLAAAAPESRILLTCYNRTLAAHLRGVLALVPNVAVMTFHQFAAEHGVVYPDFRGLPAEERDTALGEALAARLRSLDHDRRYDAVLVDEAQDFEPAWFTALLAAMKDPDDGDLLIVADGAQGLYRRSKIAWSHLGINARGRTTSTRFHLDQNYRNSSEIVAVAETFAHASEQTGITTPDDQIQTVRIDAARCLRSTGAAPLLVQADNRHAELAAAYRVAQGLLDGNWDGREIAPLHPQEIAVLYPSANGDEEKPLLREFAAGTTGKLAPVEWLSDPESPRSRDRVNAPAIKLQSIHASKGLQYRAVIAVWLDKLPGHDPHRRRADRRLLYVALTRAESYLALTTSRSSEFIDDLQHCPGLKVQTFTTAPSHSSVA